MSECEVAIICPKRTMDDGCEWCILNNHEETEGVLFGYDCYELKEAQLLMDSTAVAPFGVDRKSYGDIQSMTIQVSQGTKEYIELKTWHEDAVAKVRLAFKNLTEEEIRAKESAYGGVKFIDSSISCAQFKLRINRNTLLFSQPCQNVLEEVFTLDHIPHHPFGIVAKVFFSTLWVTLNEEGELQSWGMHFTTKGLVYQTRKLTKFEYAKKVVEKKPTDVLFGGMYSSAQMRSAKRRKTNTGGAKMIIF